MWFNGNGDTNMMNNLNNHDIFDFSLHSNIMQQGTETQPAAMTVSTAGCAKIVPILWLLFFATKQTNPEPKTIPEHLNNSRFWFFIRIFLPI